MVTQEGEKKYGWCTRFRSSGEGNIEVCKGGPLVVWYNGGYESV